MTTITTFAQAEERLAESLPGYESRPQQQALAEAIERTIANGGALIAEAGCGTGKSLATMIPAILSGKRTVVSTATKALQDQVANKDLPFLAEHLGVPFTFALLKGRSNYLCQAAAFDNKAESVLHIQSVRERTIDKEFDGERDNLGVAVSDMEWRDLTVSSDECPGKTQCPFGDVCYAEMAKAKAQQSDVVVVNHAMLSIDALLAKGSLPGVMLGPYEVIIVDEAHELESYARNAWTSRFTERSMADLGSNVRTWLHDNGQDDIDGLIGTFALTAKNLFETFEEGRLRHAMIVQHEDEWVEAIQAIQAIGEVFATHQNHARDDRQKARWQKVARRIDNMIKRLIDMVLAVDSTLVRWIETETNVRRKTETLTLKSAPLDLGAILHDAIWQHVDAAVLVSATLAVDGGFEHHGRRLGVPAFESLNVGTPFDFTTQARLYVPRHIPAPDANGRAAWNAMSVNEIKELVLASKGRALVLFTSIAQMKTAFDVLTRVVPYTVLMQGHGGLSNKELAARFKEENDSVLLGTRSFFTGVDFSGDTCSLVVLDKLPFPVPTDPLVSAQTDLIEERGGNSFADFTIPEMVLPLQQGFGRLIRTRSDRGVVAILDPRLLSKGYGRRILRSLPNAPVITDIEEVKAFFGS